MNPYYQQATYEQPSRPPMPDNYLAWAILSTILCCLPFGVVAIVYATQVENLYLQGQYQAAYDRANKARKWTFASAGAAAVVLVIYFLIYLFFIILGLKQPH